MTTPARRARMEEHCVVGIPSNRRVGLYLDAVRSLGFAAPRVVSWLSVLDGTATFRAGETVRVDSPGEDAEVDRRLRGASGPVDMHRVEGSAAWYAGFGDALRSLGETLTRCGATALADPEETLVMFDKARCHALLSAAGVRVPAALAPVTGYDSLLAAMAGSGTRRVFVKPRHGSSAAGVIAFERAPKLGAMKAVSSTRLRIAAADDRGADDGDDGADRTDRGPELYNSLRVCTYTDPGRIRILIDAVARDGVHVEAWVPKTSQQGRPCDLRVVCVEGRATHAVVRIGRSPMTNLHLGGSRGEVEVMRAFLGEPKWRGVIETAERAASVFPGTHCLGADILVDTGGRSWVGEVNAYGDLLPNLHGLPGTVGEGVDTHTAQVKALLAWT